MSHVPLPGNVLTACVGGLPSALVPVIQQFPSPVFIAGGYVRAVTADEKPSDIDLVVSTGVEARTLADRVYQAMNSASLDVRFYQSKNAYTIAGPGFRPIQVIHAWTFDTPGACIDSFDFTVAQAALWWNADKQTWEGLCSEAFLVDTANKVLRYTQPKRVEAPAGSLIRAFKFYKRGYSLSHETLAKLMARVVSRIGVPGPWADEQFVADMLQGELEDASKHFPAPPSPLKVNSEDPVLEHELIVVGGPEGNY